MKKKKLFSILCAVSLMSSMIIIPTFATELDTISTVYENIVSEESDILPSESITEDIKEEEKISQKEDVADKATVENRNTQQKIVLCDENNVIENNQDIQIPEDLELQSIDSLQTFANDEITTAEVNHAPIAGLQYAVLNPDSLVDGQFTRETQLAFFWKWDNTLYTYDIDEGDTISAYIGGVPLENCVALGGEDYTFEGFAVIDLEPGDYELAFYVIDNHGAQSNVARLSFSIIDTTEQPSPDITVFEDSLASAEDVKTYTVPVDFTQTPEVMISLIRTGASGLKISVLDEAGNKVKEGSCYPNMGTAPIPSTYNGIYNKYSIELEQPNNVQTQTYTIKVENYKEFKQNDANYKIKVGSKEEILALTAGRENVTPLYVNRFNSENYMSRYYIDQDLPSTNPECGDWYEFMGDGKMVFTIFQSKEKDDVLRFQIRDSSMDNVLYDSAQDTSAHKVDEESISDFYSEKTTQTLNVGQKYYLVVYSTKEQIVSNSFSYCICIGDPYYVLDSIYVNAENIRFRKGVDTTFTIPMNDVPDTVVMESLRYAGSSITTFDTTWYYRPENSNNWVPMSSYKQKKFSVDWKNDNNTNLLGSWEFKMRGKKDVTEDVEIMFGCFYERGDKYYH